jgi:hypothetical protein
MEKMKKSFRQLLAEFVFTENGAPAKTRIENVTIGGIEIPKFINEFWTSRQRQAHSLHEVSYRACFKPQLPRFFIERLTAKNDIVYDPFSGRGTTMLEAALLGRNVIANDVNPLSRILSLPRLSIPALEEIESRLTSIRYTDSHRSEIPLSMFYHKKTLSEILSLRKYLLNKVKNGKEDHVDRWIRMVATNRLTGHSNGYFSVYTLPPNQALSPESQRKINRIRNQRPEYRDTKKILLKKSRQLIKELTAEEIRRLKQSARRALFITGDARAAASIKRNSVQLTVTSPPFLDIVQYAKDNWLRCWFNGIDADSVARSITMSRTVDEWRSVMDGVFKELYRTAKNNGWVAFEVGEVRKGKIRLEEHVVRIGIDAGFCCEGIMINQQQFTKTANIWGVKNNAKGTNTNRIVVFRKI